MIEDGKKGQNVLSADAEEYPVAWVAASKRMAH
jgi:hypothetical protein